MARRGRERPSDDPLRDAFAELAKEHGDQELLRICLWTIQRYAEIGARRALTTRKGNPEIDCAACREREAAARQLEETLKRVSNGRPIGGAAPTQSTTEE